MNETRTNNGYKSSAQISFLAVVAMKKERRFNRYNPKLIKYGGN